MKITKLNKNEIKQITKLSMCIFVFTYLTMSKILYTERLGKFHVLIPGNTAGQC